LEVKVLDRGRGVPDGDLDRVFEKFHRLAESSSADGLGLGLSICKEFVEAHGGRISLEHNPGGGTVAKFVLPLQTSTV
jgi:two-component system sensor histidine kinase KdpD